MPSKVDITSIATLTGILGLTGACLFIWMASTGWQDKAGVVVGVIFIVLTGLQVLLTVVWWKMNKRFHQKFTPAEHESFLDAKEMKVIEKEHPNGSVELKQRTELASA